MNAETGRRVEIYDTTLRDGTQAQGVSLSMRDKMEIAAILDDIEIDYIEGGYPLSNPKDESFFKEAVVRNWKHARLAAFGMTRRRDTAAEDDKGMQALLGSEAPVITIVGKTWDLHVREVLRVELDENLRMIADSVGLMVRRDRETIYDAEHFFDGWAANPDYAIDTLRAAVEAGATCLVLCDTNGGSLPGRITEGIEAVQAALPSARIGIHCHNDSDVAVANSLAAVESGAVQVQGTINGIGERCGNADLVSVMANLSLKYGYEILRPGAVKELSNISRSVYEQANLNYRDNQPFVGASAFAHKGGMHVHAIQRNVHTYEHIDPAEVGNNRRILVSELAGVSNIAATIPPHFQIDDDKETQRKILQRVMEMENEGYEFEAAEGSYEMLIRKIIGGSWYRTLWELDHYRCVILKRCGEAPQPEATVKIIIDGEPVHTVAEGHGPVDSLVLALKSALRGHYPHIDDLHLVDYRVRVVNTQAGTAAKVRVLIEWRDTKTDRYFGSVGVDENIINASWLALSDAIEYKLLGGLDHAGK